MEGKEQQVRKILSFHLSRGERTGNRGGTVPLKHQVTLEEEDTEMELLWGTRTEGRGGLGWGGVEVNHIHTCYGQRPSKNASNCSVQKQG